MATDANYTNLYKLNINKYQFIQVRSVSTISKHDSMTVISVSAICKADYSCVYLWLYTLHTYITRAKWSTDLASNRGVGLHVKLASEESICAIGILQT